MRSILNNWDIARITKTHNGVHVRGMATHVTDDDGADVLFKFARKIVQINPVVFADFTKDWNTSRVDHR